MLNVLRKVHAWAGLALCLLVLPLAVSGVLLVFKPQWIRATVPGADASATVTADTAAESLAAAQAAFPGLRSVTFAGPEVGLHQAYVADGGGGYLTSDGEVIQGWDRNARVVDWLFDLHHHLLSGETGATVAGAIGLATALMVVTGLIVWAPAWRSFRGRIAPGAGRAGWLAAHRDLGLMAAPVLVVITLTGAALNLDALAARVMGFQPSRPPAVGSGDVDWPGALSAAQARFPDAQIRMAILPAAPGKPASIRLRQPAEWHANGRTVVWIDPATSRIARVDDALAYAPAQRAYNAFWPIHASKVGGVAWKAVTFAAGLALIALSLYGAESYRRKLFPARRRVRQAAARAG
ncbi:MAG: PepSY domain-containing protein [Phenylobacterium sp.]|uniref:PepSY-associated TM helix domain-containing protein n=1 Tax=Phenylobacterium sp. TaxID=1871053 RepID=UPI001A44AB75|nr:PepSY-associated TM helix domain-containing protein [Phenylobacterium sp.]MBL8555583.1 PepSY domain-containing protein [Phenylobacterium sp.]